MMKNFIKLLVLASVLLAVKSKQIVAFPVGVGLYNINWFDGHHKNLLVVGDQHTAEIIFEEGIYDFTDRIESVTGNLIRGLLAKCISSEKPIYLVFEQSKEDFESRMCLPSNTLPFVRTIMDYCPVDSSANGSVTFVPSDHRGVASEVVAGFCADYDFEGLSDTKAAMECRAVLQCFAKRAFSLESKGERHDIIRFGTLIKVIENIPMLLQYQKAAIVALALMRYGFNDEVTGEIIKIWDEGIVSVKKAVNAFKLLVEHHGINEVILLELGLANLVDKGVCVETINLLLITEVFGTYANLLFLGNIIAALQTTDDVCFMAGLAHVHVVQEWVERLGGIIVEGCCADLYKGLPSLHDVATVDDFESVACNEAFIGTFEGAVDTFLS